MTAAIYLVLFIVTCGYAALLQTLHDRYTPDWIWLTVVIGVCLIGIAMLALCAVGNCRLRRSGTCSA